MVHDGSLKEANAGKLRVRLAWCRDCWLAAVRPGQIWQDTDLRPLRQLRVTEVLRSPDRVQVVNVETGRKTSVKFDRFIRRYKVVRL